MAKFQLKKKIDLGKFWEGAYLEFIAPTFSDLQELSSLGEKDEPTKQVEKAMQVINRLFVDGKIEGQKVETKDVQDLPVEVLTEVFNKLAGEISPEK